MKFLKALYTISLVWGCASALSAQVNVEDFRLDEGQNDAEVINHALQHLDSLGHGELRFDGTRTYRINKSIQLPRKSQNGKRLFVLSGNGAQLQAASNVVVFDRMPVDQAEAMKFLSTRFVIRDFTISHGAKAINLGATLGSVIENCNFVAQTLAAVDVQFGLQTKIRDCNVTNPIADGFVLRCGEDWGGNTANSQSNHSVIESSRVYTRKDGKTSFKVLGSSGVVLRDVISEGRREVEYAIYFDPQRSSHVKHFRIENLHLEHAPQKAGIYIESNGGISVIDGIYYQVAYTDFPLIETGKGTGQITVKNIPYYVGGTVLKQGRDGGIAWRMEACHKNFYAAANWRNNVRNAWQKKLPYYFSGRGFQYQIKKTY